MVRAHERPGMARRPMAIAVNKSNDLPTGDQSPLLQKPLRRLICLRRADDYRCNSHIALKGVVKAEPEDSGVTFH